MSAAKGLPRLLRVAAGGALLSLNAIARGQAQPEQLRLRERACANSADLQEGLAAFAARRSARFEGR